MQKASPSDVIDKNSPGLQTGTNACRTCFHVTAAIGRLHRPDGSFFQAHGSPPIIILGKDFSATTLDLHFFTSFSRI